MTVGSSNVVWGPSCPRSLSPAHLTLKLRPSSPTGGRREGPEVALAWQLPPLLQRRRADSPCPPGGHGQRRTAARTPAPRRCRACSRCRPRPALGPALGPAPLGVRGHLRVTPPFRRAHTPQPSPGAPLHSRAARHGTWPITLLPAPASNFTVPRAVPGRCGSEVNSS